MAKSLNPLPQSFNVWYVPPFITSNSQMELCWCSSDNGWYHIYRKDTWRKMYYQAFRWRDIVRLLGRGELVMCDEVPEDDIDTANMTELL